jgi:hypothetical protein
VSLTQANGPTSRPMMVVPAHAFHGAHPIHPGLPRPKRLRRPSRRHVTFANAD